MQNTQKLQSKIREFFFNSKAPHIYWLKSKKNIIFKNLFLETYINNQFYIFSIEFYNNLRILSKIFFGSA